MFLFLKKLFYFLFILLFFGCIVDCLISNRIKKSNSYANGEIIIWNDILEGNIDDDLLVYGSSRAMVHFNSMLLEKELGVSTYNMGIDGHNFWLQYLRHKKIIENNSIPKSIILSVGDFTLVKRDDLYNSEQFLPFLPDYTLYKYTNTYKGYSQLDYIVPMLRYRGKLELINNFLRNEQNDLPYRIKGFRGMQRTWNSDLEKAKSELGSIYVELHMESIRLMKQFLKECIELNINVVIVYPPEYIEGQLFVSNREEIINVYKDMANTFHISFIDYSNDNLSFDKELFYNSMHLNAEGAKAFTLDLCEKLRKLNFIK